MKKHDRTTDDLADLPMTLGDWLLYICALAGTITICLLAAHLVVKVIANVAAAQIQAEDFVQ